MPHRKSSQTRTHKQRLRTPRWPSQANNPAEIVTSPGRDPLKPSPDVWGRLSPLLHREDFAVVAATIDGMELYQPGGKDAPSAVGTYCNKCTQGSRMLRRGLQLQSSDRFLSSEKTEQLLRRGDRRPITSSAGLP